MYVAIALTTLAIPLSGFAQDNEVWKEASPASQAYHKFRLKSTIPPYGLAKVKAIVAKVKIDDEDAVMPSRKDYEGMSLREKFTYHMICPETYSQNCDAMPPILDEEKKIFGNLPDVFNEAEWSDRQVKFLVNNRDSVMSIIKESVNRTKRVGLNYKAAIVEISGREMIPYLVDIYKLDRKDHDILTVLMLLMKKGKYKPFLNSSSFEKLYSANSDYLSFLNGNLANEELIITRALRYAAGLNSF